MREKLVCRCGEAKLQNQGYSRGRKPFQILGAHPHYAPDRPLRVEHILLELEVNPKQKTLKGIVRQKIRVVAPHQYWLKLDQVGLQIERVQLGAKEVEFSIQGDSLQVPLNPAPEPGEELNLSIHYQVNHPKRGIYFTGPDADYPNKPYQVWTQGQDEDSRHWFPTLDYPNQKATSEVIAVVPKGFTAVSNGALLSKQEEGERVRFHYRLGTPHVTYLITLVVAELSEWSDAGPRGIPVQYFVAPGKEADGKRAFGNTAKMIEVFEKWTGIPYPYEKYSQVAVQDFIFGGMENTSATTQTELTLHDERAHLDFTSDPLVSHELAHQWFGDLVTCRDWSHGWLNEGFATFMERVWVESKPGSDGGFEEAKYYSYQDLREHFAEDRGRYRRPIVCNTYLEPIDLFDTHLYQKGGLVLNLIRHILGEDLFWKSVHLYLSRHRGQNVETLDLIRAIEETTGRNLRRFFDEWVFHAGYPEFEVSYTWHEDKKMTEWVIEQKQTGGAPSQVKDGATTLLFHLPVVLEMVLDGGEKLTHQIELGEVKERIFLPAPEKPKMVRFDPNFWIPKSLKFPRPKEMLLYQLENDSDGMGRIEAALELGKIPDYSVVEALGNALQKDSFWAVQVEVAKVLAEVRSDQARDRLIEGLSVSHPKARRGVVAALASFKDVAVTHALKKIAESDPSYFVESDATYAWAVSQFRAGVSLTEKEISDIEQFLNRQLQKNSYRDVIRAQALQSLSEFPQIGTGVRKSAVNTLIEWTQRGKPSEARIAALRALGKVLKVSQEPQKYQILQVIDRLADEDNFRLRMQMVATLEDAAIPESIPILEKCKVLDADGRVKRGAASAIDTLRTSGGVPDSVVTLKDALEKLEQDYRKLKAQFEEERAYSKR